MTSIQIVEFDYAGLDPETRIVVRQKADELKALLRAAAQNIFDIGARLTEVRDQLQHNKDGGFEAWLETEFGMSRRTAYNFIGVYERFANRANFAQLDIAASALYLLAAPSTPDAAREEALRRAESGERITHKAAKRIVEQKEPEPTEAEIAVARDLIAEALTSWTRPVNLGSISNQARRLPGGADTTKKAVKAAIYRMVEAGNVIEQKDAYGRTVYSLAHDPAVPIDQPAPTVDDDDPSPHELATAFQAKLIEMLSDGPKAYLQLRDALVPDQNDSLRVDALRRALDTLFGEKRIQKDGGRYLLADPAPVVDKHAWLRKYAVQAASVEDFLARYLKASRYTGQGEEYAAVRLASAHAEFAAEGVVSLSHHDSNTGDVVAWFGPESPVIDELNAKFDKEAITILGRTDDGAWHRAIEIGRKLVAAGVWDGQEPIQFDAYALHDRLFGVNAVEPADLVDGPGEDYHILDEETESLKARILGLLANGPLELARIRARLDIALGDQDATRTLRAALAELVNDKRLRQVRDLYIPVKPNDATPPPPANTWAQTRALPDRILETLAAAPLPLEILCDRLEMTGPVQRDQVQGTLCILQIDNRVQELRGMWSVAGEELPADSGEDWLDTEVERPTPAQKDGERILEVLRKYHSSPLGFLFIRTETGLDEADFDRARNYLLSAKLAVQDGKTLKLAPQPKPEPQPDPPIDVVEVNGNGNIHFSSDSEEWYTPADIVERVIQVLTGIDLDPCSNSQEAPNVPAALHFSKAEDGLTREWNGKVWMNPPYGRSIGQWIGKLVSEYEAGRVTEAIALVPARTDTAWFAALRDFPRCFVQGRITFLKPDGSKADPAPFPSALVYLGPDIDQFAKVFADLGDIYVRYQAPKAEGGDVSV